MLRAAICDDDAVMLESLRERISGGFEALGAEASVYGFPSGAELVSAHGAEPFGAVFLDIDMPEASGFDVAEGLSGSTLIIFVTTHDELVYSSIRFQPFRFIRKTCLDLELPETLSAVHKELTKRELGRRFTFKTGAGETFADLGAVQYIEIYGHRIKVHFDKGEPLECLGSLSELEKQLAAHDFVRTHKSYLVNCKFIFSIDRGRVVLDDGTELPLSRYKAETVREKFKESLRGGVWT